MAPVGRRDEQRSKWCCKWCVGRDGKPFVNFPDKLACHSCSVAKSAAFKGTPEAKSADPAKRGAKSGSPGKSPLEQQLLAMHKQVAKLQKDLTQAKKQPLALDVEDMEAEVAESAKDRMAELDSLLLDLGKIKPPTPEITTVMEGYRKERDKLKGEIFEAKPKSVKVNALSKKIAQMESQQLRWQANVDQKKAKIAELQQEVADDDAQIAKSLAGLVAVQAERAQLCDALQQPPEDPLGADPGGRWSLAAMCEIMQKQNLPTALQERVRDVVGAIHEVQHVAQQQRQAQAAQAQEPAPAPPPEPPAVPMDEDGEALDGASPEELREYLRACGLDTLAGEADDGDLRDAVKRCLKPPTWQEVKRRRKANNVDAATGVNSK